jgi:hypothetical protein
MENIMMEDSVYNDSELQMDTQLILCFEERDENNETSPIDIRLFIGWSRDNSFFVRGKRQDYRMGSYVPFAFHTESVKVLGSFIELTTGLSNMNIILYNFNNMTDLKTKELTYEFFDEQLDKNYEICAYDKMRLTQKKLIDYLRILKCTRN